METPTAADVRDWSQLDFGRYGYSDDTRLGVVVARSVGYVRYVTGQDLAAPTPPENLTADLMEPILQQAIQMRTEQIVLQGRRGHLDSAASNEVVSSFSAGSYHETRRDPSRRGEQRSLNTWPALDELLWMLMTPERFAWWWSYISGQPLPDFRIEEVHWGGGSLGSLTWFEPWDRYVVGLT